MKTLASPQSKMALKIASVFCSVSTEAAAVVAGILPIHLMALVRSLVKRAMENGTTADVAKTESRGHVEVKWQNEWDSASNGRWTHRGIPSAKPWSIRKHGNSATT